MVDKKEIPELKCNCDDSCVTGPCLVHPDKIPVVKGEAFRFVDDEEKETIIITDEHMQKEMWVKWEGWGFVCPSCQQPSIMVNKDMNNRCVNPDCGKKVSVQSKIITDYIRHNIIPESLLNRQR